MKKIPLTQGLFALVDDEDFDYLSQWKWFVVKGHNTVYAGRRENKTTILMHRVVANVPVSAKVDHKDRNGLNNQRLNLRSATRQQNGINRSVAKNNTSGHTGVSWSEVENKYKAYIKVNQKLIHLGTFNLIEDAISERKKAEKKYFGEFAPKTN